MEGEGSHYFLVWTSYNIYNYIDKWVLPLCKFVLYKINLLSRDCPNVMLKITLNHTRFFYHYTLSRAIYLTFISHQFYKQSFTMKVLHNSVKVCVKQNINTKSILYLLHNIIQSRCQYIQSGDGGVFRTFAGRALNNYLSC